MNHKLKQIALSTLAVLNLAAIIIAGTTKSNREPKDEVKDRHRLHIL